MKRESVDSAIFQKLEDLSVVRGADDPLAKLQKHIATGASRVLLLAESDGRRESLLDFFRASGVNPPVFDSLAEFQAEATEKVGIATSSLMTGFAWVEEGLDFVMSMGKWRGFGGATDHWGRSLESVTMMSAI